MTMQEDTVLPDAATKSPARLFICYGHEDDDIVSVFETAFEDLGREVDGNLWVFRDRTQIPFGGYISDQIRKELKASDYLIVFYTNITRRNVSWNGVEVGFFQALMEEDMDQHGKTDRRIVPIYFDDLPPSLENVKGISLKITPDDLSRSKDEYIACWKERRKPEEDDPLSEFLREVASLAERRNSATRDAERKRRHRDDAIDDTIVPRILGAMHQSLGGRVAIRSIEQRLIEIQVEPDTPDMKGIPQSARLREQGKAFAIFKLASRDNSVDWAQFFKELGAAAGPENASAIGRAMDRVFKTAIDSLTPIDNDQLIRSPADGELYRVLVTSHFDYYNGRKTVHMYFIETLKRPEFGSENTTVALAYLNSAARYRAIFLETKSELSVRAFRNQASNKKLQDMVAQTQREIILLEDEARQRKLDSFAAKIVLWGDQGDSDEAKQVELEWTRIRNDLFVAAEAVLRAEPEQREFAPALANWMTVLESFTQAAAKLNVQVGELALKRLGEFFTHGL